MKASEPALRGFFRVLKHFYSLSFFCGNVYLRFDKSEFVHQDETASRICSWLRHFYYGDSHVDVVDFPNACLGRYPNSATLFSCPHCNSGTFIQCLEHRLYETRREGKSL